MDPRPMFKLRWREIEREPSWQWAARSVDYSRVSSYDTPYRGAFDPGLLPFWKEVLDTLRDPATRECVVLKNSRAGFSENVVLTDMRYTMAVEPEPTLYVSGKMDLVLGFLDRRVKRGMGLVPELARMFRQSRCVDQDVQMPGMDFRATWQSSDTATKQDGWARIYGDEVSTWANFRADMIRKRCAAYPFSHIIWGSSIAPDRKGPVDDDPILVLWRESDQRLWFMDDPAGGPPFYWTLDGIKWAPDCKVDDEWNLDAVRETAYYETPGKTRIENADRMELTRAGRWVPTNEAGRMPGWKVTAAMMPFTGGTFGELAARFLSAKYRMNDAGTKQDRLHNPLRVYFAEEWAETHREEQIEVTADVISDREEDYDVCGVHLNLGADADHRGNYGIILTADVQKYHVWWLCRVWESDGENVRSALLDWGTVPTFHDLDLKVQEVNPSLVGIDNGYQERSSEVVDYCARQTDPRDPKASRVVAMMGQDNMKGITDLTVRDALEGRGQTGATPYCLLSWNTDVCRSWLLEMISGLGPYPWSVPARWGDGKRRREYVSQVTTTRKVDGEWQGPKNRQDHLFDCECEQVALARWDGLIQ
jgi:hypothetical protein